MCDQIEPPALRPSGRAVVDGLSLGLGDEGMRLLAGRLTAILRRMAWVRGPRKAPIGRSAAACQRRDAVCVQLYVDGELVGGADIVEEMHVSGELKLILSPPK